MSDRFNLVHNKAKRRFEFHIEGFTPHIEYMEREGKIYLVHTRVPEKLEGQGIASNLVKEVFRLIEKEHMTLVPVCDFVKSYLHRHPEWNHLLKENNK